MLETKLEMSNVKMVNRDMKKGFKKTKVEITNRNSTNDMQHNGLTKDEMTHNGPQNTTQKTTD